MCFLECLLVFGREKKYREQLGRRKISKKCLLRSGVCQGLFIALRALFEATAIVGPAAAFQWPLASNGS